MQKTLIVLHRHREVYVVIPRNEAAVPYGTKRSATVYEVRNPIAPAYVVNSHKHASLDGLKPLKRPLGIPLRYWHTSPQSFDSALEGHALPIARVI